jgi:hypothetical protein
MYENPSLLFAILTGERNKGLLKEVEIQRSQNMSPSKPKIRRIVYAHQRDRVFK